MDTGELAFVARLRDEASNAARMVRRNLEAAGGRLRPMVQQYRVDVDQAHKGLGSIRDNAASAKGELGGVAAGLGTLFTKASLAGPAALAVGAGLSALASGGTAVVGALGPAAAAGIATYAGVLLAVKSAGAVTKFALDGVSQAANGDAKAMSKLTPEGQKLAGTLGGLKPKLDGIRAAAQRGMFPGFNEALGIAQKGLPAVTGAAGITGAAIGGLSVKAAQLATSGPFRRDFSSIARQNAGNITNLGTAGLSLANAARSLLATGMPVVNMFTKWSVGAAASLDATVQSGRESGKLAAFWQRAAAAGATVARIAGNVGHALYNVFKIGNSGGQAKGLLDVLEKGSGDLRKWTESARGVSKIGAWFAQGRTNLGAMGRLIRDITKGLSGMGSGATFAPLVDQLRTQVLPPLMEFLHNASAAGALSALVGALGSLARVLAEVSSHDSSLKAFAGTLKVLADAALWVVQNVPGAGAALGVMFTAIGVSQAVKLAGLGGVVRMLGGALLSLAPEFLVASAAADADTTATGANTLARRISTSTLGTWVGVKAIEAAAWARSLPGKLADTGAMVANKIVYGVGWLTTFLGVKAIEAATWARSAAATVVQTAALVAHRAVVLAITALTRGWAIAQAALNLVMSMNPVMLAVIAIAALVAIVVIAWQRSQTFRTIVLAVWAAIKTGVLAAVNAVRAAIGAAWAWIKSATSRAWNGIRAAIGAVLGAIRAVVRTYFNAYRAIIAAVWGAIRAVVSRAIAAVRNVISAGFGVIRSVVSGAMGAVRSVVSGGMNRVRSAFSSAISAVRGVVSRGWAAIRGLFSSGIGKIAGLARGIGGRIMGAIGSLAYIGRNMIEGIIGGIGAMASAIANKAASVVRGAVNAAKGALGIHSPSRVFRDQVGVMMGRGVAVGLDASSAGAEAASARMAARVAAAATVDVGTLGRMAADASRVSSVVQSTTEQIVTIRHEVTSPDGSLDNLTADEIADIIARDPKAAAALEGALARARARKTTGTFTASR